MNEQEKENLDLLRAFFKSDLTKFIPTSDIDFEKLSAMNPAEYLKKKIYENPGAPFDLTGGVAFFHSISTSEETEQLKLERENILIGMKSVEATLDFYRDKHQELQQKLTDVEDQLQTIEPESFQCSVFNLSVTHSSELVAKADRAIMNCIKQTSKPVSEMLMIMHPKTCKKLRESMMTHAGVPLRVDGLMEFKGVKIFRSLDFPENEIIVR